MTDTPTPADLEVPACPICGADVTEETGYADNFGRGEYQYAQCQDCTYQSDWPDHMRLHIFADPEVAYEAWIRTIPGEFDRPHISEAFTAGYAAGQTLASASAVPEAEITRVGLWNTLRDRGMNDDAAMLVINTAVGASKPEEPNHD